MARRGRRVPDRIGARAAHPADHLRHAGRGHQGRENSVEYRAGAFRRQGQYSLARNTLEGSRSGCGGRRHPQPAHTAGAAAVAGEARSYFAFFCFCWPTRTLNCFCWASWYAFQSNLCEASERYLLMSISLGSTAIRLADILPSGLVMRYRFTFGMDITYL